MWVQSLFYPIKFWLTGRHAWHNNSGRRLAFLDVNRSQNFLINFMHEARISLWLPIRWPFGSVGKGAKRGQGGSGPWSVSPVGGRGHARDRHTLFPAFHLSFVDRLPKLIEFLPDTEGPGSLTRSPTLSLRQSPLSSLPCHLVAAINIDPFLALTQKWHTGTWDVYFSNLHLFSLHAFFSLLLLSESTVVFILRKT